MNKVSANYINLVNDSITKAITDIIKDNSRYVGNGFDIVKALLDNDKLSPLIEKFIKSKMMETNAEIVRNGVPDIVTRANVNTLTDNEMLDFVEDNKAVQQYISKLYWKSYLESIDIDAIKKIIKDRYYDPQYEQEYDDEGIEIIIYRAIYKTIYGDDDVFPYTDTHLISNEFTDVLERELPKEIFEARVTPVGMNVYPKATLYITSTHPTLVTADPTGRFKRIEYWGSIDDNNNVWFETKVKDFDRARDVFEFIRDKANGKIETIGKYIRVTANIDNLQKIFSTKIINEARVTPVSMSRYNNATVYIIDNDFVVIEDNEGNEYNGDIENDGTVNFLLIFESDDNTLEFMDEEEIFDTIAPEVFKQIRDAGGKIGASSDSIDVTIDVKTLKKLYPTKYENSTNEARVTPVGMSKGIKRLSKNEFPIDHYQFEPHIHEAYEIQNLDSKDSTTIRKDFDILTNLFKKIYNQYNPTNEFNRLWVVVSYDNGQNNIFTLLTNGTIPTDLLNKKYPGYSWYDAAYVFPENHTLEDVLNNYI